MKHLLEWIVYGVVLAGAVSLVSSWQTRDMLGTSGAVTINPVTLYAIRRACGSWARRFA